MGVEQFYFTTFAERRTMGFRLGNGVKRKPQKTMLGTNLVTSEDITAHQTSEWLESLSGVVEEGGASA
jgi:hypothetical protein